MKQYLTKKILNELKNASIDKKDEFDVVFWPNFGAVLKEGLCEPLNTEQRESIMEICRFYSSKSTDKMISLDEYLSRMQENQKEIFYINSDSLEKALKNPHLEGFMKRDIEVLFMIDSVDDFWVNVVLDYKDKKFKSIAQENINLNEIKKLEDDGENQNQIDDENLNKLLQCFKETLGSSVQDVVLSTKLRKSPACLGVKEGQMNMKMERFLIDQRQLSERSQKVLEINKNHELIVKMNDLYEKNGSNEELKDAIKNLFDFVCIIEGEPLADSSDFSERASKIINNIL
jgi:molecular chaperone HtpG